MKDPAEQEPATDEASQETADQEDTQVQSGQKEAGESSQEEPGQEESGQEEPRAEVCEKEAVLVQSSQAGNAQAAAAVEQLKQKLQLIEMTKSTLQLLEGAYQVYMGVGSYTQGVDQISTVVQSTSITAEGNATSSQELSDQAETLEKIVERFQLEQ